MTAADENQNSKNSTDSLDSHTSLVLKRAPFFAVHALLLDCVIETQLAQSPLRWWVSAVVVIYFAFLAVVYRRVGRSDAAGLLWPGTLSGTVALVALVCCSSLHPAGMIDGVRLLGMTTSTVQIVVTMIGVGLFGVLSYLTFQIDKRLRIAVGVIAIYALISFLLGLVNGTPYVDLLQGSAFWSVLPRLLQGCVLGALLILPVALVHQIALRITSDQDLELQSWSARTICGALCVLLAFQGVFYGPGRVVPTGTAQTVRSLPPLDQGPTIREAAPINVTPGEVVKQFDEVTAVLAEASQPFGSFPVSPEDVVRRTGSDPVDLYQWVRNNTAFVPYRGVLRGPEGVMMDRDGNALDRALLLHRLLTLAGHRSRLASGTLDDASAARLASNSELAASRLPFSSIELTGPRVKSARERVTVQSGQIAQLLEHSPPAKIDEAAAADIIKDHWWVQVQNGEQWHDLDPLATEPEESLTLATATFTEETLPKGLFQQITVRVLLETREKQSNHHVLAEISRPAHTMAGTTINISHLPLGISKSKLKSVASVEAYLDVMTETDAWLPLLTFEGSVFPGLLFTESGEVMESTDANIRRFSKSGVENIQKLALALRPQVESSISSIKSRPAGESAGQNDAVEQPPAPETPAKQVPAPFEALVSEWIEIEVSIPGGDRKIVRRVLFDDRESEQEAGQKSTTSPAQANPDQAFQYRKVTGFLRKINIATETAKLSGASLTRRIENKFSRLTELRNLLEHSDLKLARTRLAAFMPDLRTLQTDLDYLAYLRWKTHPGGDDLFLAQPSITLLGSSIDELGENSWVSTQAIDIAMNPVEVRPDSAETPFNARLAQGVADTLSEALIHPTSDLPVNMAVIHDMAVGHGVGFKRLSPHDKNEVETLELPQVAKDRLKQDLVAGHVVLVPNQLIDFETGYASWWRIDPVSGNTLGMVSSGAGGAIATVSALDAIGMIIWMAIFLDVYFLADCITGGQEQVFFFVSIKGADLGKRAALCSIEAIVMNALFAAMFKMLSRHGDSISSFLADESGALKWGEPQAAHRTYGPGEIPDHEASLVGMNKKHMDELAKIARTEGAIGDGNYIILRASNPESAKYHGIDGYVSKPVDVKLKTDPVDGLVHAPTEPMSATDKANLDDLLGREPPWSVDGDGFLLDPDGNRIFGDHDLMGVYDRNRRDIWSDDWNDMINESVFRDSGDMLRHGPNDGYRFPDYANPANTGGIPGRLPGSDEIYVVMDPDGTTHIIEGTENLEDWYREVGLPWRY